MVVPPPPPSPSAPFRAWGPNKFSIIWVLEISFCAFGSVDIVHRKMVMVQWKAGGSTPSAFSYKRVWAGVALRFFRGVAGVTGGGGNEVLTMATWRREVRYIILPTFALEHKLPIITFAQKYPGWRAPYRGMVGG